MPENLPTWGTLQKDHGDPGAAPRAATQKSASPEKTREARWPPRAGIRLKMGVSEKDHGANGSASWSFKNDAKNRFVFYGPGIGSDDFRGLKSHFCAFSVEKMVRKRVILRFSVGAKSGA
jgi:hypothetical protein